MTLRIYHNPRCSKSSQALRILLDEGVQPAVVEYLREPPAPAVILQLAKLLGVPVADLLRRGDAAFRDATDLPALDNDAALAGWLSAHPAVLQRPIVVDELRQRAVIARPPENVLKLLAK